MRSEAIAPPLSTRKQESDARNAKTNAKIKEIKRKMDKSFCGYMTTMWMALVAAFWRVVEFLSNLFTICSSKLTDCDAKREIPGPAGQPREQSH